MKIAVFCISAILTGCAVRPPPPPDPSIACFAQIESIPALNALVPKVGGLISAKGVNIESRSNPSKPTLEERSAIVQWDAYRQRCFSIGAAHRKQYLNPRFAALMDDGFNNITQLITKLYQGSLSYGEFIVEREKNAAAYSIRFEELKQRYAQEQSILAAQRQAASDADAALGMQLLNAGRAPAIGGTTIPSSMMMRPLRNQWQSGTNRMCQYSDGSVINVGVSFCPLNLN